MPHVIVKLWPGKPEEQKRQLSEEIVRSVMRILGYGEESVSVSMEEIETEDWKQRVYQPDILDRPELIYKKPGYRM